ncbi:hypothetical protein CRUP_035654 [Coryphaenoides rupestris]|nr:hypothetical protein CRUP_035654 [Coryphaenoides rupestris]
MEPTFLYFAYGSNLLKERLQLHNPSAAVHCVARLQDYKLTFGNYRGKANERWHGGVATMQPCSSQEVWGVVWRMNLSDLASLDSQENVSVGSYSPMEVLVSAEGEELTCRTYIMNSCVPAPPSPQYLQPQGLTSDPSDHFLYFAYGSNMLRERLQLRNPSASFVSVGCVQEGVPEGYYRPLEVNVSTAEGDVACRSYQIISFHPFLTSPAYKQVVSLGARQSGLPLAYIQKLEAVETNAYQGPSILDEIEGIEAA